MVSSGSNGPRPPPPSAFIFGPARYLCTHFCAYSVQMRPYNLIRHRRTPPPLCLCAFEPLSLFHNFSTFLRIFSPHPPLAGQIPPQNPCKLVKSSVIFHFFGHFFTLFSPAAGDSITISKIPQRRNHLKAASSSIYIYFHTPSLRISVCFSWCLPAATHPPPFFNLIRLWRTQYPLIAGPLRMFRKYGTTGPAIVKVVISR